MWNDLGPIITLIAYLALTLVVVSRFGNGPRPPRYP